MQRTVSLVPSLPPVCRLGLATRGNTHLRPDDVQHAIEHGINYLNWCGKPDGMSEAVVHLGAKRKDVVVAVQFKARTASEAQREFAWILDQLQTDYLDVATFYYVESEDEWQELLAPDGAWHVLAEQKRAGALKMIGLTSHQRKLAAGWAQSRVQENAATPSVAGGSAVISQGERLSSCNAAPYHLDLLMIRYNGAHRGAEQDVFPITEQRSMPVVTFTGLRWRALLQATREDPAGFEPPSAAEWYRFCLANPAVTVAVTAPGDRAQLTENLRLLKDWRPPSDAQYEALLRHGDRVRRHSGEFW